MKKFLIMVFILAVIFSVVTPFSAEPARGEGEGKVYHLFTHALIAYPELAFAEDNPMRKHYDKDCLTVKEFESILTALEKRNYILVSPEDVYEVREGTAYKKELFIEGKKPLLMSFDDINYYSKKMNLGMNDKLIVMNGKLATYTENADEKVNYCNEAITILESFLERHPDFSYKGARGTICLTGFDGILGYRTQGNSPNRDEEIEKAKKVVEKLKKNKWRFACHSYGHYHMKRQTTEAFCEDIAKWKEEVEPLVGRTDIYVYPYGEYEIEGENCRLSKKHEYLKNEGFSFFWGVGSLPFFGYLPFNNRINDKSLFMDRTPLDGFSLRNVGLEAYFNQREIIDKRR